MTPPEDPGWRRLDPPLPTPWSGDVAPDNALPEYPRPQLTRPRWLNLNGVWEYAGWPSSPDEPRPSGYAERILVPFPPESALSGIRRRDEVLWYRRLFEVPADWHGSRVLLHFGAVDQTAKVWVNNQLVATHEGGYTAFSADVTDVLRASGPQELTVRADDRTDIEPFPVGKQRNAPGGICYTPSSGIWQTVWLEPVPEVRIERLDLTPDLTGVTVFPQVTGGAEVVVVISANDVEVARASGPAGTPVRVDVPSPRLWTPDDPHLYSLRVRLLDERGSISDEVGSYAGLRTIGLVPDPQGRPRIALNGRVTFLHGPLDQGYWPDGISTAPTDDALRFDLEKTKELGFNFVRKHVKVEPARWYFWADTLGLVVWQDMPSLTVSFDGPPGIAPDPVPRARERFEAELAEMVTQLRAVPSIVGWVPFNEGWGEFDTARVAELVKTLDPTRLVIANSGVNCCFSRPDSGAGDVYDDHTYVGPGTPSVRDGRAIVDGEYGGLGLILDDHRWPGPPNAYEMTPTRERLTERYAEVSAALERVVAERGLSGAVYTQTTDVENEVNGLLTYDRRVVKVDPVVVAKCVRAAIETGSS
ncbi:MULTISPECIES: sugar-binding domain-containing protein [unclassified Amycolatopsis]|uniref:glycoside hydrolase family 2 protein n=1 Tax=unclassified Amycolatopsis TaxID=2618356 RepID=UPI0028750815|nr:MULTISPECIES: sugar-binding domain-containing protein [unclassified Amycolatopsis]MDS0138257.1 glycoside hydrolase family 2 [Amycolatopsis sp. 505]MDS0149122.1 glycoside hydrolase family 2 [Amycolatopsis sp. CM201R]